MSRHTLENRVETLELKVEALEQLPDRVSAVESQIVQLREEMRGGFSTMEQLHERTIGVVEMLHAETNRRIDKLEGRIDEFGRRIDEFGRRIDGFGLRMDEFSLRMDERHAETKRHTSLLFEEAISRIARIGEGRATRKRR
jgi:hypothetical protein